MPVTQLDAARQVRDGSVTNAKLAGSIGLDKLAEAVLQADGGQALTADLPAGGFKITGLGTPTANGDAATKSYVDGVAQGLDPKGSALAVSTTNVAVTGTQTIDGVALSAGDRVLLTGQTTVAENGLWIVAGGAWTRPTDYDSAGDVSEGAYVFIEEGTNEGNGFVLTELAGTFGGGYTTQTWQQFTGAGQIGAGDALTKTGNTLNVAVDGTTIATTGDQLSVLDSPTVAGATPAQLRDRSTHTGTQTAATISDFNEAAQDAVGTILTDSATVDFTYNDVTPSITATVLDSPTVEGATAAQLRDRSTHTGTQAAATISDLVETIQDTVGAMVSGNTETNITVTYDDSDGTLDFVVTASSNRVVRETPTGAVNGSNTSFVLASAPAAGSEEVFLNGILQEPGAGNDYTISGDTITYLAAPVTGDRIRVSYVPA